MGDADANEPGIVWAYLEPLNPTPNVKRIVLCAKTNCVGFGRVLNSDFYLNGKAISEQHAIIQWNGQRGHHATYDIIDMSHNGTFVDGIKVQDVAGLDPYRLRDGCIICFGSKVPVVDEIDDFRFKFYFNKEITGYQTLRETCNRYHFGAKLGQGAFGTVHVAVERKTGQVVAIKTLINKAGVRGIIESAGQEIAALMCLQHPNICVLKEVYFRIDGTSVDIVLEYIDGGTLEDQIAVQCDDLSKEFTFQLCRAMSFIHAKGISHRDLKPPNILLTTHTPPMLKIADFGIAQLPHGNDEMPAGTPGYAAPEMQRRQYVATDRRHLLDSWAVGVLIFNMLSCEQPFVPFDPSKPLDYRILWHLFTKTGPTVNMAKNLIANLLMEDPSLRPSLTAALTHPWLSGYQSPHPAPEVLDASGRRVEEQFVDRALAIPTTPNNVYSAGPSTVALGSGIQVAPTEPLDGADEEMDDMEPSTADRKGKRRRRDRQLQQQPDVNAPQRVRCEPTYLDPDDGPARNLRPRLGRANDYAPSPRKGKGRQ
ncbi:kinase-like domain-containing protein [Mycena sp. CBHHK59/15]|nr:kinase-like domain-containing protein [Mycena sp. CBHHK59/15]